MVRITELFVLLVRQANIGFISYLGTKIAVMVDAAFESHNHPDVDFALTLPADAGAEGTQPGQFHGHTHVVEKQQAIGKFL